MGENVLQLYMVGVDFTRASMREREPLALVRGQVIERLPRLRSMPGVAGCVLLATCNRTELYAHSDGSPLDLLSLLCGIADVDKNLYRSISVTRTNRDVVQHLLSVAAGLKSQIFGDDQIISQVREAWTLARDCHTCDGVLDTLFRYAVATGKRVRTEINLVNVPASAADTAVSRAVERFGTLQDKNAVVIGNGVIGRRAASALRAQGAAVTMTLRTYRHGETIIPAGCRAHPYDRRYEIIEGADLVLSATASPHYTLTADQITALSRPPTLLIDLAAPRDIDPAASQDKRVTVWNLDDLSAAYHGSDENRQAAEKIISEQTAAFNAWLQYRNALPVIAQMKDTAVERVRHDHAFNGLYQEQDTDGLIELAVGKTIDLLLGGMKDVVQADYLTACLKHMRKGGKP